MRTTRIYSQVIGWGMEVPSHVVTNNDLSKIVDTNDEWIRSRSGIGERRVAGPKETTSSLATGAAARAMAMAHLDPSDIDLILVATATPDYAGFPSTASLVQDALGAKRAAACDVSAACSGYIYALSWANSAIVAGQYRTVLVIGAETMSHVLDWSDRSTCVLFGDGAGALVLQAIESAIPTGILDVTLGSDGSGADLLKIVPGGVGYPAYGSNGNEHYCVRMNGREVFKFAVGIQSKVTLESIHRAGLKPADIDLFVPHQANSRIIDAAAKAMELPPEKVFKNLEHYGNTSAASIPIGLCEAAEQGRLHRNDTIALVGFGAGLTWGACVMKWGPARVEVQRMPWESAQHNLQVHLRLTRVRLRRAVRQFRAFVSA